MSPRWERVAEPPPVAATATMDAMLTPHRSLTARALLLVLAAFSAMNVVIAIFWALNGAWPVLGFLVIDVALLTWAFSMNNRAARMFERVRVEEDRVCVTRQPVRGPAAHWVVAAAWARVESHPRAVRIAAGDRAVHVGAFLSPPERDDFADALRRALQGGASR
jgi:uncharacterized membrane protein